MNTTPQINQVWPEQGGIFVGTRLINGQAHHIIIPGGVEHDAKDVKFDDAAAAIPKELNGHGDWRMPEKEDLQLAYINSREHFEQEGMASVYWSGTVEGEDGTKRWSHGIRDVVDPLNTITAQGAAAGIVTSHMIKLRNNQFGQSHEDPVPTLTAGGGHAGEVRAFLVKYYGSDKDGQDLPEPLHTVPTRDRFGLVMVHGEPYAIVDIGLRMLTPRELFRAQGFPDSYQIETGAAGESITKTAQVRMCGNSVCPPLSHALVAANYSERQALRRAA